MKGSVRKRGEKWSYYFTIGKVDGKYKKKEKSGFATKREAEAALREAIRKFETEGHITQKSEYTLSDFIKYWYDHVAVTYLKHKTLHTYSNVIQKHIDNEIGYLPLNKVTPIVLQEYFSKKQERYEVDSIISIIRNILSNTFKLAVKQKLLAYNPMSTVELKAKSSQKREIKALTPEAISRYNEIFKSTRYYLPFWIALLTGGRRGEILGLTWEDIDFEKNTLSISKNLQYQKENGLVLESPKTVSSYRVILMPSTLRDILLVAKQKQQEMREYYGDHYYTEHNFVCCNEDGSPINPMTLSTQFLKLSKNNNLPYSFHDLRHTHATMALEADVNVKVLQERLGHSQVRTTLDVYSHVTKRLEEDAIDKFNTHFNNALPLK